MSRHLSATLPEAQLLIAPPAAALANMLAPINTGYAQPVKETAEINKNPTKTTLTSFVLTS